MRHIIYRTLFILSKLYIYINIFTPFTSFSQLPLVTELNNKIFPLKSTELTIDNSDLEALKYQLKDKLIIGLGEATHGTHEFFTMKHRMVEFLVKEMGFKTFVIEADFAGAQAMNDYIINNEGSAINALKKMAIGVWFTKEFLEMIDWMKRYNSTQSFENKIKFYGCDMQLAMNSAEAVDTGTIKLARPLSEEAKKGLKLIQNFRNRKVKKSEIPAITLLQKELSTNRVLENDTVKSSLYNRYIQTILQTIDLSQMEYHFKRDILRDEKMAENCDWIFQHESKNKMIIWAHNLHIAKDFTKNYNLPMGYYLNKKYPSTYYAIGFGFNRGSFRAYDTHEQKYQICTVPDVTIRKSTEYIFTQCTPSAFFLDFNLSRKVELINRFLNQKLSSRAIGAAYNPSKQRDGGDGTTKEQIKIYDALLFIKETTPVVQIIATEPN